MNIRVNLTEIKSIRREMERIKAARYDPLRMVDRVPEPEEFAWACLNSYLDKWQTQYMFEARARNRVAIAACRQSGKSTVTGLFVAWCLLFIPGFQCLVASRSLRQASHYLNTVRAAILAVIPRDAMVQLNRLSMELPNGSQIISIPCAQPDAGRGFSPHLVILDEAAFAPEELFRAITPSLSATRGALHMLSSPNGRQGYFFEAFEGEAMDVFWAQRVPYTDCPRIDEDTIAMEKVSLGELYFRQEYGAEFITPQGAFFGHTAVLNMQEYEEPPLDGLELADMDLLLEKILPVPEPNADDLRVAFDRTDRVNRILYD